LRDQPLDRGNLRVEELDLAHAAVDRLALLERQLQPGEPLAALDAEQVTDRWTTDELAHQHRVDLVLRARARPDQPAATRQPPAHHPRAPVGHPDRVQRPRRQQPRQRAGVEPVGLRASPADAGIARTDDKHPRDVRLDDPRDLPRVPGHLKRDPILRAQAGGEQLQPLRRGRDPSARAKLTILDERDLTEIEMNVQRDRPHHHRLPHSARQDGRRGGQTTPTDPRSRRNRTSRSGGHRKARAQTPIVHEPACPACVLPETPVPVTRP